MPSFVGRLNKLFVALYKALGLAALALILLGLFSYLTIQGFYLLSSRWVAPTIVSPLDEHVLRLNTEIAEKAASRDRLAVERAALLGDRDHAARTAAEARAFQQRFHQAVRADRADRARARLDLAALRPVLVAARRELDDSDRAFSGLVRTRSEAMRQAGLLEREALLTINHQLSEQAVTELSLSERAIELGQRLIDLDRDLAALDAAAALGARTATASPGWPSVGAPFTTRVLLQARESVRARMDEEHAEAQRRTLDESLALLDGAIGRYDRLLATLRASPWLAASEGNVTVAFVPYENLKHVREGDALYRCAVGLLVCRRVGKVGPLFQGEATMKHPVRQTHLRGAMVQLDLEDAWAGRETILHVGGAPLLF